MKGLTWTDKGVDTPRWVIYLDVPAELLATQWYSPISSAPMPTRTREPPTNQARSDWWTGVDQWNQLWWESNLHKLLKALKKQHFYLYWGGGWPCATQGRSTSLPEVVSILGALSLILGAKEPWGSDKRNAKTYYSKTILNNDQWNQKEFMHEKS